MVNFSSLYHFVSVSLLEQLICPLRVKIRSIVLVTFFHCEIELSIFADLGELGPDAIIFFKARVLSPLKHLPSESDLANVNESFTITGTRST